MITIISVVDWPNETIRLEFKINKKYTFIDIKKKLVYILINILSDN